MPLFQTKDFTSDTQLGIWEITESFDELLSRLKLNEEENAVLERISHPQKALQWVAARNCLRELIPNNDFHLTYNESGKPLVNNGSFHFSLSHSGMYACVLVNYSGPVGVDIERIGSRIFQTKSKFLNREEFDFCNQHGFNYEILHVIWGAKEALFKLCGDRKIDFKTNINIPPFNYTKTGSCSGEICTENKTLYTVHYEKLNGFMLVYAV